MIRLRAGAAVALLLAGPGVAGAATVDGAMITNAASVTYSYPIGTAYTVSYCATVAALVVNPCTRVAKAVAPTVVQSGGKLTYEIRVESCSARTSSFDVTATDRLPDDTAYAGNYEAWAGSLPGAQWSVRRSPDGAAWSDGEPPVGQAAPYYLRWRLDGLPIGGSAYVRFAVRVR